MSMASSERNGQSGPRLGGGRASVKGRGKGREGRGEKEGAHRQLGRQTRRGNDTARQRRTLDTGDRTGLDGRRALQSAQSREPAVGAAGWAESGRDRGTSVQSCVASTRPSSGPSHLERMPIRRPRLQIRHRQLALAPEPEPVPCAKSKLTRPPLTPPSHSPTRARPSGINYGGSSTQLHQCPRRTMRRASSL